MSVEEAAAGIISKVGLWWPLAEEDQLRQAAGGYEQFATAVREAATTGSSGARLVTGGVNRGRDIDAFEKFWAHYDGGGQAGLPATAKAAANGAQALDGFADEVAAAKRKIINLAIEIGATIAVGAAAAIFTLGGSAAAAAVRTAILVARGWLIAQGLSTLVATIVTTFLTGATFGAVEGFISSIVAQVGKIVLSDGKGISLSETLSWTAWGAATGPLAAGASVAARSAFRVARPAGAAVVRRIRAVDWADETGAIRCGRGNKPTPLAEPIPPESVPPPMIRDRPLKTKELDPRYVGENDPTNPHREFFPDTVHYMTPEELEAQRLVVVNGRIYRSDSSVFETQRFSDTQLGPSTSWTATAISTHPRSPSPASFTIRVFSVAYR